MSTANAKHAENRRKLTRAEKKEIAALIRAAKGDGKAHTAQQTIPYLAMYPDGICKVTEKKYSKSIAYDDINYQLAQADDKTAIFENWCDFLNYFDATVSVQLSFINRGTRSGGAEEVIAIPAQNDAFNSIRTEYADTAHDTQPPKPHTEASLLSAMERAGSADTDPDAERKGLGTPATRAAVIEKLVKSGFVQRKGKQLIPTKNGNNLVCVLPDTLTSPQLTAEWENALTQIARGAAEPEDFMRGIEEMARELVKAYPFLSDNQKGLFKEEKTVIGKCPRCGGNVCEGRKNYYCEKKDCAFVMWKNDRFFEERKTAFSPEIAAALLAGGRAKVKRLYSPKTGKTYDGSIVLADTGGKYVNYRIELARDKELTQQA